MPIENIINTLRTYNSENNEQKFSILDALILNAVTTSTYTTDQDLAERFMCSERTVKRSINKLAEHGFIAKHLDTNNTKTLTICSEVI